MQNLNPMNDTQKDTLVVGKESQLFAHVTIYLSDGSVADSTKTAGKPQILQLGNDSLSNGMEQQLLGMTAGQSKKFILESDDAFGPPNPDLIQYMDIQQFSNDIELAEGVVVAFEQPNGQPLPGIIREVKGHSVKVDFNHPLSGQPVTFEIELVSIDTPPEEAKK